jgi:hypothetical protein
VDSQSSSDSSKRPPATPLNSTPRPQAEPAPPGEILQDTASIAHLAEAIEGKHRVRERLVRALARASKSADAEQGARAFDPADADMPMSDDGHGLERNPLGEYLLNCELQKRPFGP